ncbi:hypothetical protein NGM37_50280, partial [Streptomyces sp. TRM76130]|nr:hypothetical protein [Streptomyces sp. TRM76130]
SCAAPTDRPRPWPRPDVDEMPSVGEVAVAQFDLDVDPESSRAASRGLPRAPLTRPGPPPPPKETAP